MTHPARPQGGPQADPAERRFGRQITADHAIIREADKGRDGEKYVIVVLDRDTNWVQAYPVLDKTAESSVTSLLHFMGPKHDVDFSTAIIRRN